MVLNHLVCLLLGHKWKSLFEEWSIKNLGNGLVEETEVFVCTRCGKRWTLKGIIDYKDQSAFLMEWRN